MNNLVEKVISEGSKVTVKIGEKMKTLIIVTPEKVNVAIGAISFESPLGRSLIGRKVGDIVTYINPIGQTILTEVVYIE